MKLEKEIDWNSFLEVSEREKTSVLSEKYNLFACPVPLK